MLFLAEGGTNPVFQEKVGKQISRLQHRKKDGGTGRGAVLRSGWEGISKKEEETVVRI